MIIPAELRSALASEKNIVITSHHNPDGDAIGSVLALGLYLRLKGHRVVCLVPNAFPDFLAWMNGAEEIMIFEKDEHHALISIQDADMVFCLDYNALERAGRMHKALRGSGGLKIMIDHHPNPLEDDFDFLFSTIEISSTAELVYDFILADKGEALINKDIATSIYVGVMTDTGSFSYSCNYEKTYRVVADLILKGVDASHAHRMVYDTFSESRLRLLGYCLSEKLIVLKEYATAYITLSLEELDRFKYQVGDTEGVVNYALSINGIVLAVLMTERDDKVRISFRSKGDFSVNQLAREHFSGGGHRNAAGGDSYRSLQETIQEFESLLPRYKDQLLKAAI